MSEGKVRFPDVGIDLAKVSRVTISACGTAYYAGIVAKYWLERYARIPVEIDVASELRYREAPLPENGLAVFVSQSGETADTLATLRYCKANGQRIASAVNVRTSTIARERQSMLPSSFECIACDLKILGFSKLSACNIGDSFTSTYSYDAAEYFAIEAPPYDGIEPDFNEY